MLGEDALDGGGAGKDGLQGGLAFGVVSLTIVKGDGGGLFLDNEAVAVAGFVLVAHFEYAR